MLRQDPQHPKKTKMKRKKRKSSRMQGSSPKLIGMSNDLNEASVDDPEPISVSL